MTVHPALNKSAIIGNSGLVTNVVSATNPQNVLGTNSPAAAAKRVAQANQNAAKNQLTDSEILDILFPGEMKSVSVLDFMDVPSDLVNPIDFQKGYDAEYAAWTNSSQKIYALDRELLDGFTRIFVLYHEGLHIRQFKKNGKPKLFQDMLRYETVTYGKSAGWLKTEQAKKLRVKVGMSEIEFNDFTRDQMNTAASLFRTSSKAVDKHISAQKAGATPEEIDKIYFELMIKTNLLPNRFVNEDGLPRYTMTDLYESTDKEFITGNEP